MPEKYRVTDVNERRRFTRAGRETLHYSVHIETTKGATGSVRIPASEYETEKVKALLDALQVKLDFAYEL